MAIAYALPLGGHRPYTVAGAGVTVAVLYLLAVAVPWNAGNAAAGAAETAGGPIATDVPQSNPVGNKEWIVNLVEKISAADLVEAVMRLQRISVRLWISGEGFMD